MQRCFLEILRIGPQHLDGSHVGKLPLQTPVLVFGGSEPHPVVRRLIAFIAEDEDNLGFCYSDLAGAQAKQSRSHDTPGSAE